MEPACASGSVVSGHYCSLFEIVPKERRQRGADTRVAITSQVQSWIRPQFSDWQLQFRFLRCTHRNTLCHGHSCFRPRREFDLDRHRFCYGSRCLKFLADRGNRVAHFPDSALQIVGGYAEPLFQTSNLAGVSEVNPISNGLRPRVVHLGRLP